MSTICAPRPSLARLAGLPQGKLQRKDKNAEKEEINTEEGGD